MPEGDTVWRTALHLDRALSGARLVETDFRVPAYATLDLSGHRVEATVARGKHLLTRSGPPTHTLHTHLKMEGSWHLYRPGSRWRRPAHQARVVLRTQDWTAVGFALGVVEVLPTGDEEQRGGAPGSRPAGRGLGRGGGLAPAAGRPRPARRRGAARPAQPGGDRQPVQERAVLPRRCASRDPGGRSARPAPSGTPRAVAHSRRTRAASSRPRPGTRRRGRQTLGLPSRAAAVPSLRDAGRGSRRRDAPGRSGRRTGVRTASPHTSGRRG